MAPVHTNPLRRAIIGAISSQSKPKNTIHHHHHHHQSLSTSGQMISSCSKARLPQAYSQQQQQKQKRSITILTPTVPTTPPTPTTPLPSTSTSTQTSISTQTPQTPQTSLSTHPPLPAALLTTLPLLHLQSSSPLPSLYATIHIHTRPYLVTLGDKIRLPFLMPHVSVGDTLRLTTISSLGTREYTLRGAPWVDARLFEVRATVLGVESEPMRVMQKRKQRNRKIKSVRSKHRYTELVVGVLRVKPVGEIVADAAVADHPLID